MRALLVLLLLSSVAAAKPKREPVTVVIAIDRSSAMDKASLAAAKAAALATAAAMDPADKIAVIGYDKAAEVDVPLQSAAHREEIGDQIELLESTNGGADMRAALAKATATLHGVTGTRHVIVITATNTGEVEGYDLARKLHEDGATITTVGLRGADRNALSMIADVGNGRLYMVDDVRALPKIGVRELAELVAVRLPTAAAKKRAPGAVVIVIDRSGSMKGAKLDAAKDAVKATVAALDPDDIVSVVAFDSEAQVYVRPQRAQNRTRIGAEIARLVSGGGTNMYPAIKEALEILQDVKVKARHVILLSDGETPSDGIAELVADMRKAKITISTVAVAGADEKLLEQIAKDGGGRMYKVDDLTQLSPTVVNDLQQALK